MDTARHRRAKEIFLGACDLGPAARAAELALACGDDHELRASVEAMLAFDERDREQRHALVQSAEPAPGWVLDDRYELRERIGVGGLGEVWSARQIAPVERDVAVKVIKLGMDTRQVIARFEAERRTLAILDHPRIARVLDAGATPAGRPYFAMELIDGEPITAYAQRARLGVLGRLELVLQLCQAVQHAHHKGIVHRDLKPSNVLATTVDGAPFVKVIDFGIAKAMQTDPASTPHATLEHQVIGTPAYMSPEQARGSRDVDTRTDVWAIGAILHELLAGSAPFDTPGGAANTVGFARLLDEGPAPLTSSRVADGGRDALVHREEVRGDLDWIVSKALRKDRDERYASVAALADDLVRHLKHEPVVASSSGRWYRLRKLVRRNRVTSAAAMLVFVALVGGIVSTWIARDAEHAARLEALAALAEAESAGEFLAELLGSANPNEMGRDVRVVDVLARVDEHAIRKRFAGRPRAEVRVRRMLGSTLRELGLLDDALRHHQRAAEVARATYPADHPEMLSVLLGVTSLYDELGRYADSEPLHRELLALYPRVHGPDSRRTLGARCNFGLWLYDQGRAEEAEQHLAATLAAMQSHLAPDDAYLLNCMQALGTAWMDLARYAEARSSFLEVRRRCDASEADRSTTAAQATANLGLVAYREQDFDGALEITDQALERYVAVYGEEHWRVGHVQNARADILVALGRVDEAGAARQAAHSRYVAAFGAEHPWTVEMARKLGPSAGTATQ